jgi:malonyl-CoA/methylmalonyl-CoA synthetase
LDVERVILSHPIISDCAVIGLRDEKWGQKVFALIQLKNESEEVLDQQEFKKWCSQSLPKYSVPSVIQIIKSIPRNQLGKVNKKELIKAYEN